MTKVFSSVRKQKRSNSSDMVESVTDHKTTVEFLH